MKTLRGKRLKDLAINNNAHFLPFKQYFDAIELDWVTLSKEQGIQIISGRTTIGWVSSMEVLRFLEYLEMTHHLKWAYEVANRFDFEAAWLGISDRIKSCKSIVEVVRIILKEHPKTSTHGYLWVEQRDGRTLLCNASSTKTNPMLNSQIELYRVLLLRNILRLYLGSHWQPNYISLACKTSPFAQRDDLYDVTVINSEVSAIEIPHFDLQELHETSSNEKQTPIEVVENLLASLIGFERLSIDLVASQLGLSRRTLQRLLKQDGRSFKELRRKASIRKAAYFLYHYPDMPNDEIVHLCGYSAYPNFHRAFKAEMNMTPAEARTSKTLMRD